jgi:hypothetical protein
MMPYDRSQAVQYAALWWAGYNPQFRAFHDDCTSFISQCLLAGGLPMQSTGRRDKGWWYHGPNEQWSYSWAVAHSLGTYLHSSGRAERRASAGDLAIGDVISYDWNGDGAFQHNVVVVGFDAAREPLVAAHSVASWGRPWPYHDSPAYTPSTKYLFLHIKDLS